MKFKLRLGLAALLMSMFLFLSCDAFLGWLFEEEEDNNNNNNSNNNQPGNEINNENPDFQKTIDKILSDYYENNQLRGGVSLAITRNEKLVYAGAVGYADRSNTVKLTPQHTMRLASVSKPITSIAIAKLSDDGKLSLDDNVFGTNGILKNGLGMPTFNGTPVDVTVRQILEHKAGFKRDIWRSPGWNFVVDASTIAEPLEFAPGTITQYSNFAYNILGKVIEAVTEMPYEEYVREYVLKLCGITEMRVGANTSGTGEVEYINRNFNYNENNAPGPSGGWIASPIDLMKLMAHVDGFSNVPDILKSDTPRINVHSHGGALNFGTWTALHRRADGFTWTLLMNYRPSKEDQGSFVDWQEIPHISVFNKIRETIKEWPEGTDLSQF